ncbi:hypothetical protein GCM10007987_23650 [Aliivibrio fischeri]|nr:hypothetical protein GCM10007987_23650 [Aliivibrio fischeri]
MTFIINLDNKKAALIKVKKWKTCLNKREEKSKACGSSCCRLKRVQYMNVIRALKRASSGLFGK